ncbi:HIT family protein [Gilvimarinus agarilyticus]|uniref:HIT family protein n=1 Tax=unclassified Gilvimarinus TaxID=2642066 RepID=UPI001C0A1AD9|nr:MULTISPECIES: HIT family protein [unclassified Gilvimarinus]MBU2886989.1 HIT family protein [Gilvimarinus agarilyticus]MDO6571649.1 HIT family protein [Gilvimarinus sp. 2_MG-2023]MDO6745721.1 HIT family protein [Gilvimarinus sp. 1_MG-2023]
MASVFSKIIARELPGNFVWEDEESVAIMTIAPLKKGHVLVIPKQEVDHWYDLPDATIAHLSVVSKKVAKAMQQAFPATRVAVIIAGLEVPHTHLHLIPMDEMQELDFANAKPAEADDLARYAEKIKAYL